MRLRHALVVCAMALAMLGCAWHEDAEWAGLTKGQAIDAARKEAIRSDYRGDARLFNLNLWSVESLATSTAHRKVWLVKFYDAQALKASCAYAWWAQPGARTQPVRCATTVFGEGKPKAGKARTGCASVQGCPLTQREAAWRSAHAYAGSRACLFASERNRGETTGSAERRS